MIAIRDLAVELRFTSTGSIRAWCDRQGIERVRRLPEGADHGQTVGFVSDSNATLIRAHYEYRTADRTG